MLKNLLDSKEIPDDYLKKEWEAAFKKAELQIKEQTATKSKKWLERSTFTLTCLEQIEPGETIKFNGYECVVLDPKKGLVIFKEPIISMPFDQSGSSLADPDKQGNILQQLNSVFLNGLSPKLKKLIRPCTWQCNEDYSVYAHVSIPSFDDVIQIRNFDVTLDNIWLRNYSHFPKEKNIFESVFKSERAEGFKNDAPKKVIAKRKLGACPIFHLHPKSEIYDGVISGSILSAFNQNESPETKKLHELPPYSVINFAEFLCLLIDPKNGYLFMIDSVGQAVFDTHSPTWYGKDNPNNIEITLNEVFYEKIPDSFRTLIMKSDFGKKNTYIGLISQDEWEKHSAYIHYPSYRYGEGWGWTSTMPDTSGEFIQFISPTGKITNVRHYSDNMKKPVHPTFHVSPDNSVDRYGRIVIKT